MANQKSLLCKVAHMRKNGVMHDSEVDHGFRSNQLIKLTYGKRLARRTQAYMVPMQNPRSIVVKFEVDTA